MDELVFLNPLSATATLPQQIKMLKQQLAAALEREKLLRECVGLYADNKSWECLENGISNNIFIAGSLPSCHWSEYTYQHGYEPAQECVKKVEAMK